jgi:peptidoglycan/LPS O-acetylase OafA/YrhL
MGHSGSPRSAAVLERPGHDGADRPSAGPGGAGAAKLLPYNPAFDGIRGLAVAAVLLFHHGVSWMRGGYLGVSTFFTLSGFLITSLLLAERAQTGTVRLSRFWARRVRRLLPASALTLLGVVLASAVVDQPWERSLRGDVFAALFQVANWRFLFVDRSYNELFADPSPVLHFWSLAIEEQFYWLFPLATVGILVVARGSHRVYGAALAGAVAISAGLTLSLGPDQRDAVYYGTFTRMAEILAGALLAVVLIHRSGVRQRSMKPSETPERVGAALGVLALGASVLAWGTVDQTDAGLYRGGLLAYAAVSTALVAAAALAPSLQRVLGWGPLRALGLVSYGTYLFHWPIYLLLDSDRTGLPAAGWALGALRIGVTLVVATASFILLEQPVRTRLWWPRIRLARAGDGTTAPAAAVRASRVAATGSGPSSPSPIDPESASGAGAASRALRRSVSGLAGRLSGWPARRRVPATAVAGGAVAMVALVAWVVPLVSPPPPADPFAAAQERDAARIAALPASVPRVMFFGDSSALMVGAGVGRWGLDTERLGLLAGVTVLGCGIARDGEVRRSGTVEQLPVEQCDWSQTWPDEIARQHEADPRIAVVLTGTWDVLDHRLPGDDQWRGPGDPTFDRYLRDEVTGATELLRSQGLTVVWLTTPPLDFDRNTDPRPPPDPPDALARVTRLNELVREVAAGRDGVAVVDLHAYFAGLSADEDVRLRPDGVHVEMTTARDVAEWLGPEIIQAATSVSGS